MIQRRIGDLNWRVYLNFPLKCSDEVNASGRRVSHRARSTLQRSPRDLTPRFPTMCLSSLSLRDASLARHAGNHRQSCNIGLMKCSSFAERSHGTRFMKVHGSFFPSPFPSVLSFYMALIGGGCFTLAAVPSGHRGLSGNSWVNTFCHRSATSSRRQTNARREAVP